MIKKALLPALLSVYFFTLGCVPVLVGAGAGVGVYSYMHGELRRSYQTDFDKTVAACEEALKMSGITVLDKKASGIKTTLTGRRSDDTSVTVKVKIVAPKITEVSVRTGVVGVWDREYSRIIHVRIAEKLQQPA